MSHRPARGAPRLYNRFMKFWFCIGLCISSGWAAAYPGEVHQQLSFLAARQFNRCVEGTDIPPLTTLNVRYAARASNAEANTGFWRRTLRWQFYDRAHRTQGNKRLMWFVETRMHERFNETVGALSRGQEPADRYSKLGRLINHIQDVTSPVIVVPIYYERFWALSLRDRFSEFPLTLDEHRGHLDELCAPLLNTPRDYSFDELLTETADRTIAATRSSIQDLGTTWQVFWREANDGAFGDYGVVGNSFGIETTFPCGRKECRLLRRDPLYFEFAQDRHKDAVLATMRAFLLVQRPNPVSR